MDIVTRLFIELGFALIDLWSRLMVAFGRGPVTPGPGAPFKVGAWVFGIVLALAVLFGSYKAGKRGTAFVKAVMAFAGGLALIAMVGLGLTLVDLPRAISTAAKVAEIRTQPVDVANQPSLLLAAEALIKAQREQGKRILGGLCDLVQVSSWDEYKACYLQFSLAVGQAKSRSGSGVLDEEGSGLFVPVLEALEAHFYGFGSLEDFATQYGFLQAPEVQEAVRVTVTITVSVTADILNVRAGPGIDHDVVDTVTRGTSLEVVKEDPAIVWKKVQYDGEIGWVHRDYVSEVRRSVVETRVEILPTPVPTPTDLPNLHTLEKELVWLAQKTRAADAGVLKRWIASPCREQLCKDIREKSLEVTWLYWDAESRFVRSARAMTDEERNERLDATNETIGLILASAQANDVLDDQRQLIEEYIMELESRRSGGP